MKNKDSLLNIMMLFLLFLMIATVVIFSNYAVTVPVKHLKKISYSQIYGF